MTSPAPIHLAIAVSAFAFCMITRVPLEQSPVTHILVQLPLLAASGWFAAQALRPHIPPKLIPGDHGISGLLAVLFCIAYWMLPRNIDAALESAFFETAKFVSIPLLAGGALALSWPQAHPLVRGFLKANALSMLGVLGFLYTHAPVRICNNYLVSDQEKLGFGFLYVAIALALVWSFPLFAAGKSEGSAPRLLRRSPQI